MSEPNGSQVYGAFALMALAVLCGVLWAYLVLTEGVYGPGL